MLQNFKDLFPGFSDNSRIWLYLSNRVFNDSESNYVSSIIDEFTKKEWNAHGAKLVSSGKLLFKQLIILTVDEDKTLASGCSIDSSVKVMKKIGQELSVDFLDRLHVLILNDSETQRVHLHDLKNFIDWKMVNPMVQNLEELRNKGVIDVKESVLIQSF